MRGGISGPPGPVDRISKEIILTKEDLTIVFPVMNIDHFPVTNADMTVRYILENKSTMTVEIPVAFLSINISDTKIILNDSRIKGVTVRNDEKLTREFFERVFTSLKKHEATQKKNDINPDYLLYDFLNINPEIIRKTEHFHQIKGKLANPELKTDLTQVHYTLRLKPGTNEMRITCRQQMAVDEGKTGYFKRFYFSSGVFGLTYPLYPAGTWEHSENFRFNLKVILPDYLDKKFFLKFYDTPDWKSNLPLKAEYDSKAGKTIIRGEYSDFPEDFFEFIFWKK